MVGRFSSPCPLLRMMLSYQRWQQASECCTVSLLTSIPWLSPRSPSRHATRQEKYPDPDPERKSDRGNERVSELSTCASCKHVCVCVCVYVSVCVCVCVCVMSGLQEEWKVGREEISKERLREK